MIDSGLVASSADTQEVDFLRNRVRLYLLVMFLIDISMEVLGATISLIGKIEPPDFPSYFAVLRWTTTAVTLAGWAVAKYTRPGRPMLLALETGVTLALCVLYSFLTTIVPVHGASFGLLVISMALVMRASLVPSTMTRTIAVGVIGIAVMAFFAQRSLPASDQQTVLWLILMGVGNVAVTSVTSKVIYGLRRQVRHAMRLGQYELGQKLGEGGMGAVYKATHVMLRRPTAVKLLPIDKVGEQTVARFEREVQQTSRLEHPNSVFIYDYGRTPDGQFYYAMEYLDGVTLKELVEEGGAIPQARAVAILHQAANALAEAHAMGLVHRDVKPANIMLCERAQIPDTVKVLDFGLVKSIDNPEASSEITQGNAVIGTPHYLAPEAIARPDDVGPPVDIYALGAVAFFLITGRRLFTGRTVIEVCSQHLHDTPESPSAVLGQTIEPTFEALILRCLAKEPDDRPQDGAALAEELAALTVSGWTTSDARAWWRSYEGKPDADVCDPLDRTQLAVNMSGRD